MTALKQNNKTFVTLKENIYCHEFDNKSFNSVTC